MRILRRIGVRSAAKVAGALYGLMGLFFGAVLTLVSLIGVSTGQTPGIQGLLFGVGSIIVLPILYGVMGYIMMAAVAALFNLVAGWTGGLELDLEVSQPRSPQVGSEPSSGRAES